jgi:hypothetical protein
VKSYVGRGFVGGSGVRNRRVAGNQDVGGALTAASVTAPIIELGAGLAQIRYVTADPRSAGLSLPVGSIVAYAPANVTPILLVKEIANNNYGWRRINEKYVLPGTGAEALGLLGFTPTSMFKPGDYPNSCPDLIGANHLTAKVTANANMNALIDHHRVWWGNSTSAKQTADVLSPALNDFWAATVFTLPGPVNTTGILGRYSATPKGWCCYFLGGALHAIINDGTHGSGVLSLAAPALRPDNDPGTLYLLQFSFNRGTGKVNVRLGKRGAAADKLQDSDQSAITLSLAEAGKEFGFGVTDGGSVLTGGGAYAWAAQLTGTAKDQTAMAAIETAMGFAA